MSRSYLIDDYSYECIGVTKNGDYIIQSHFTTSENSVEYVIKNVQKNVLKEILFHGIKGDTENRIKDLSPLCDTEILNSERGKKYFETFFTDEEMYTQYVGQMPNDVPRIIRSSIGYRIAINLIVKWADLRTELENKEIIKSLTDTL